MWRWKNRFTNERLNKLFFVAGLWCLMAIYTQAQSVRVHGYIIDASSQEAISYAYCVDSVAGNYVFSNESGYFSIVCKKGSLLRFSYLGYVPYYWIAGCDTFMNITLQPRIIEEVRVYNRERLYLQTLQGKTTVPVSKMQTMPMFAGLPDIIKNLTYLPGVSMGKEGYANLYVRGGSRDQNLILIDGAPLFSYSHAGGLVSSLNADGIQNFDFYKAGFPARFGNFASSVIDLKTKDGNANERKYKLTIGTLVTTFAAEGPLVKQQTTFSVAARTTYYDLINLPRYIKYLDSTAYHIDLYSLNGVSLVSFNAFDVHLKVTHNLSKRHKIWSSFFTAQDYYTNKTEHRYATGSNAILNTFVLKNYLATFGCKSVISDKIYLNNTLLFSRYSNNFKKQSFEYQSADSIGFLRDESSSINYFAYQGIVDFTLGDVQSVKAGLNLSRYFLNPHVVYQHNLQRGVSIDTLVGNTITNLAYQISAFAEDEIKFNNLSINAGIRFDEYITSGKKYFAIQPRVSLKRMISNNSSLKVSYSLSRQFLFSVTRTFMDLQKEIWLSVDSQIAPILAHHGSIGFFGLFNDFEYGLEVYGKKMFNLVEYKSYSIRPYVSTVDMGSYYRNGKGEAYGFETFIGKEVGKITGTLSYTLSYTFRQFPELNSERKYPYLYDHRHMITATGKLPIDQFWSVALTFVFLSGQPFTVAESRFLGNQFFEGYRIYSGINNYRLPPYHRLDLLFIRSWKSRKNLDRNLKISIYNVYNRRNPAFAVAGENNIYLYSLYGIIPTVSYEMHF